MISPYTVKIKKVEPGDNQKLLKIGYQTFYNAFGPPANTEENIQSYLKENFTLEIIDRELANPDSEFYFALIQTDVVGYLKVNFASAQTEKVEGRGLEVERIYVVREYQGKNIGQTLLDTCIDIAQNKEIDFIWLGVWNQNLAAIRFYERNGFKIFDQHQFILGTEEQTDLMMKLEI